MPPEYETEGHDSLLEKTKELEFRIKRLEQVIDSSSDSEYDLRDYSLGR